MGRAGQSSCPVMGNRKSTVLTGVGVEKDTSIRTQSLLGLECCRECKTENHQQDHLDIGCCCGCDPGRMACPLLGIATVGSFRCARERPAHSVYERLSRI